MISIVTPSLNGAKFILKNIESIQKLSIPYEHIIVDGGSTDGTLELISKYSHIKLLHQFEKNGMYGAIHQGFLESTGNYLTWVNVDDQVISEGYLKLYNSAIKDNSDLAFSDGLQHFMEEHRYKYINALPNARYFLKQGIFPFIQPSAIFSRSAYLKVGGLNYSKFKIIGDRDLFQRMAYDKSLRFNKVNTTSSVFLRYSKSLLYSNLELLQKEHSYTIKTNQSLINRLLYHTLRLIGSLNNKTFRI